MSVMSGLTYDQQIVIRSIGPVKEAFGTLIEQLRSRARLRFKDRKISREAFANAMILYLAEMPREQVEQTLRPYVRRLEEMIDDEIEAEGRTATNVTTGTVDDGVAPAENPRKRRAR